MSKIGFCRKGLGKKKNVWFLNINSQKDLKDLKKTRVKPDSNWLDYRGVKHGSFMWIVTGFCVPLFLSSSHF